MMSKLFKLKDWLTVPETAKHLSIVFGEDVKESDVLRLALDRYFTLSLYLPISTAAKPTNACFVADMPNFDPAIAKHLIVSVNSEDVYLSIRHDVIEHIEGVFDLLLIRGERLAVEAECLGTESRMRFKLPVGNQILVEQNGQLFCLQQHFRQNNIEYEAGDSEFEIQGKIAVNNYCNASRIPDYGTLIVRTDALREFEAKMEAEKTSLPSSTDNPRRREQQHEIILAVIAALEFDPLQIPDRGCAKIKAICLTRPRIFTDSGFDHAWKAGVSAGFFKMANHEKFTSK